MRKFTQSALLATLLAAALPVFATGAARDADAVIKPPPRFDPLLEPFLRTPIYSAMTLSPDGKHVAAVGYSPTGTSSAIAMIDTETLEGNVIVQPRLWKTGKYRPYMRYPRTVTWLSDDRIAVNFTIADAAIFGIDGTPGPDLMQGYAQPFRDAAGQMTGWHLVMRDAAKHQLSKLNVNTNENFSYDLSVSGDLTGWASDSLGDIRVVTTMNTAFWSDETRVTTWYRENVGADWQKVDERSILDDPFRPLFVPNRPNRIIVQARNGGDRLAIWDYDVVKHAFVDELAAHTSEDVTAIAGDGDGELQDVVTDGLKRHTYWFESRYARLQTAIDAALPDHVNSIQRNSSDHLLIYSYSDVDPGSWFLLDTHAMKLKQIARRLPGIDTTRMQPMQTLTYPSFDGLPIPAYLTLPGKPTKPAPLIVLIHGGPQARDRWEFNNEVQLYAAHGYAVFQPQFRGSEGFGKKFEEAGFGQWGQAMQDDITAGVHYLIDQKIADPARICIIGGSYGGYAALWGLEKTPELYKCGVSVAGVSDLQRMLHDDSDMSRNAVAREFVRNRLGDEKLMKTSFDSVSPLKHADRIVAPTLIVHGKLDVRVPISHGEQMRDAMQDLHKDVQWLEFDNEGHGIFRPENKRVYYDAVFTLLARTIGKGEPPFPATGGKALEIPIELAPNAAITQ